MKQSKNTDMIIDIHSHILPGIDDGSADMEETLQMLMTAEQEGITHMIATPHYKENRLQTNPEQIKALLDKVKKACEEQGIAINLYAGNEVYYFSDIEEAVEEGRLLALNEGNRMLVEFNPYADYKRIRNAVDTVRGLGFHPVIAHVERYDCMLKKPDNVEELYDMDAEIQVNAASITGEAGFKSKMFVHKLLKKHLVHYVGTDAHESKKRAPKMKKCASILRKKFGEEYANELLYENALTNIINDN
ncbi:MAG: protein-tyrosine-phosphatase [Lachnospiraceae bacterium]|nr:protein-tyrosine-phosphatase [Lachnospiraceae bacterium]